MLRNASSVVINSLPTIKNQPNQERRARQARRLSVFGSLMMLGLLLVLLREGFGLRRGDLPTDKVGYVVLGAGVSLAMLDFLGIELFRDSI